MDFNTLTPEEKINKYNEFNSTGNTNNDSFAKYIPQGNAPVLEPTIDYTSSMAGSVPLSPFLTGGKNKDLPGVKREPKHFFEPGDLEDSDDIGKRKNEDWMKNFKPLVDPQNPVSQYIPLTQYRPTSKTLNFNDFEARIRKNESDGVWTADGGKHVKGSTATGAYQFVWSKWGKDIMNSTGVKSRSDFMHNPGAQQNYFQKYFNTEIMPAVNRLKAKLGDKNPLNDFDLAQLIHFQGEEGARKKIAEGKLTDASDPNNPSPIEYITR